MAIKFSEIKPRHYTINPGLQASLLNWPIYDGDFPAKDQNMKNILLIAGPRSKILAYRNFIYIFFRKLTINLKI